MAVISMAVLRCLFLQRVISHFGDVSWPLRPPDLAAPDIFLWGYLKIKVYSSHPINLNDLKQTLHDEITNIPEETIYIQLLNSREPVHSGAR